MKALHGPRDFVFAVGSSPWTRPSAGILVSWKLILVGVSGLRSGQLGNVNIVGS
jgi:hypothetical protein